MEYKIFDNGELINTIIANEPFVFAYCEEMGYTYEKVIPEEQQKEPTTEERIFSLEEALARTDETAIALYESQAEQEAINAAQFDALIEIYELIGG